MINWRIPVNEQARQVKEKAVQAAKEAFAQVLDATGKRWFKKEEIPWSIRKLQALEAARQAFEAEVVNSGFEVSWQVVPKGSGWQEEILKRQG
jgi:nucleotide-binding universal stress UspA family protein